MKLYMVTAGCYLDYGVCGIYSSEEKAERAKSLYAADHIQEMELDEMPDAPPGLSLWRVAMDRDGDTCRVWQESANSYRDRIDKWEPYGDDEHVCFCMWASNEEHAVKIANERRTQLIALNQWTTDYDKFREAQQ